MSKLWETGNRRKSLARKAFSWLMVLCMVFSTGAFTVQTATAATGDTPPHTKNITDNQDGTYTISLDIVGESEKKPNNINVIVIMDTSGSMTSQRMTAAKNAVNSLANALYAYNTPSAPNTVEMALVRFATSSSVAQQPTSNATTFRNEVNGLPAQGDGGTNWEAALQTANGISFGDQDQTFVVFVSDGNPTFRTSQNGWNDWSYQYQQWGNGQETAQNIQRCYTTAVDDAQALATKVTPANFFTIGAFGNVDRMEQLTDDAGSDSSKNYYSAQNTAALNQAIADILAKIEMAGFADAEIDDGTTSTVTQSSGEVSHLLIVDESSYKYYRTGGNHGTMEPWTDAPEAKLVDGTVVWDISDEGVLENGVRYTVTFDCYPSQETYDIIAQLKNGDITYASLDSEIKKYIVDNGGGSYSLRTNTNAGIKWDDTRDDEGQQTADYTNPDPVKTDASTLTATKVWEGGQADTDSVEMTILMDDKPFHTTELTKESNPAWSTSSYISYGIIKGGEVLKGAEGHDFKFAELDSTQYHWELETPTVHPMIIDGTPTMLVMVDKNHPASGTTYTINGKEYYKDSSVAGLTAVNHRRSNLNIRKDVTGEDAPKDATFPFKMTVNNAKADDPTSTDTDSDNFVWFSIYDTVAGKTVTDATISGVEGGPNADGYYWAKSGATISVDMKAGWNLRFTNLPTETTYTLEETLPADSNFAFKSAELKTGEDSTFSGGQTTTGTIEDTKTSYQVVYTNDYGLTDLEIKKVWNDANNQDGMRLTADELKAKLSLSPAVEGKEPTVKDNGDGTYTITYKGLPRYNNGQEVTYKVTESAIDGYTTSGSPAEDHGTITNTHTPEKIDIPVEKVWNDNENQDGIRPTSVSVQLKANGVNKGDAVTLDASNQWKHTWEDLDKFAGGQAIVYSVEEVKTSVITGTDGDDTYGISVTGDAASGFVVTNTHTPQETKYSVTKVWNDANDKDGKRPESIQVQLKAGSDNYGDPVTLNADNSWKYTWEKLPKKANGTDIVYTADETAVPEGYTKKVDTDAQMTTITNTHVTDKTTYTVSKVWDDNDNQDGIRPGSITVQLKQDGENYGDPVELNEDNEWTYTWEGLEKNKDVPSVTEDPSTDDAAPADEDSEDPENGSKAAPADEVMVDDEAAAEEAPAEDAVVEEEAPAEDDAVTEDEEVETDTDEAISDEESDSNKRNAPTRAAAKAEAAAHKYVADEVSVPDGYVKSIVSDTDTAIVIKNTHTPATTELTVKKIWDDNNNQDGVRPTDATVQLYQTVNGKTTAVKAPVTVGTTDDWTYKWSDLPVKEDGETIVYSVEETLPDGSKYVKSGDDVTKTAVEGNSGTIEITNKYVPETKEITVTKVWDDASNQDGVRPDDVDFTVTGSNGKTYDATLSGEGDTWTAKIKVDTYYNAGQKVEYTVDEETVENYEKEIDNDTLTITNTYSPETTKIEITKKWDDANNQDGVRPTAAQFKEKVHLYMSTTDEEGTTTKEDVTKDYPLTVKDNGNGTYTVSVEGLPMFKPGSIGSQITWTIGEDQIAEYTAVGGVTEVGNGGEITNKHEVEKDTITVTKIWDDANDQDGVRPDDVTFTVTGSDGKTYEKTFTGEGNTWTADIEVEKYTNGGQKVTFTVDEEDVDGYEKDIDNDTLTITNSYEPETETITVKKVWDDASDQDGIRPEDVDFTVTGSDGKTYDVTLSGEGDTWTADVEVEKYTNGGEEVTFTVDEEELADYDKEIDNENLTITNSYEPETKEITVTKVWEDASDQDGIRPDDVEFTVTGSDGKTYDATLSGEGDTWTATVEVDKYYNGGQEVTFTVDEEELEDYEKEIDNDTLTITNSYEPETKMITVTKVWEDASNQDGIRPDDVEFTVTGSDGKTYDATLSGEGDTWTADVEVEKYTNGGEEVTFTVDEEELADYEKDIDNDTLTITNSYEPQTTDVSITKKWDDANNQDGYRPTAAQFKEKVHLYMTTEKDGKEDVTKDYPLTVTDNGDGTYTVSVKDLPMFKPGSIGSQITWTIGEDQIDEYTAKDDKTEVGDGGTITNVHEPETMKVTVEKIWNDSSDQDGKRANVGATVQLYKMVNGTSAAVGESVAVGTADDWSKVWENLPVNENGEKISYYVVETLPDGSEYTKSGDGEATAVVASKDGDETITVTNSYETKKIDVEVNKTWDDADDQDGKRADVGATIQLYANDKAVGNPVEVGAEDDWSKEWENLPVYENGKKIEYSVVETLPDGSVYETTPVAPQTAEEDTDISFAVTNKHEPEPTEVTVEKKWAGDEEWADEVRPDSIKVTLYANGEKAVDMDGKAVAPAVITAADKWTYTFTNVPKYNAGKEITYTVKEAAVAGYDTTYSEDTLTITNTYHPTPVDASFDVTKDMAIPEGLTGPEDWSYTFTAEAQDNAPAAETMTGTATKAEPTVTFGDITFEMPGEYQYIVTESGEVDGVTNDEAAETGKLVKIIVTGDKSGNLTAEVVGADGEGDATTFTNSYAVEPVTVDPPVRKELTGADIAKYEGKFKFKIEGESAPKGVDEIPMPKHETISNSDKYAIDVEGETYYEFGEIEYTMPGEYTYKISEVSGKVPGVTYDKTEYTLTVTVTDNGDGTLSAVMDPEAGDMVFTNEYKAKPVKLEIEATKVLKGRELKAGEFTFQLKDGDKVVAEGTNDANGKIVFDELTFKKAGTYTYSMLEVIGDEKNMKYDTDVHTVTVEVTDEGIGQLKAVCEDEITFTNTYKEKPKKPEPTPKTGDDSMDSVAILGLFASAALLGLLRARRRSDKR